MSIVKKVCEFVTKALLIFKVYISEYSCEYVRPFIFFKGHTSLFLLSESNLDYSEWIFSFSTAFCDLT